MRVFDSACSWLAVATLVAAGAIASAQGPGPGFGPGFGGHRPPMEQALGPRGAHSQWWNNPVLVEKLKLTDDQRKAMDQIVLQHRATLIDMRANLEKAELGMEPLIGEDQPNEAKILAQIDKVAQARAELEKANARFLLALRAKLTPDQWKQLKAARGEHMSHMEHREGPRNGRRPMGQGWRPGTPQNGPASQVAPQ